MKKVAALIGIGYWGKVHLKYLINIKDIDIKYIFYRKNFPRDIPNKYKKKLTNNLNIILNDHSVEYVHIVTPIDSHQNLTDLFLSKNKKILVEKPLIINNYYRKKFYNYLDKKHKNLVVSYPYLFSDTLIRAKNIIIKENIGKLKYITINLNQCGRFMKYDVNELLAPHAISILSFFLDIKKIKFSIYNLIKNRRKIETVMILCLLKNKNISTINLSLNYASNKAEKIINLFTESGTISCNLNNNEANIKVYKYKKIKKNNYYIGKTKLIENKKFDEKNNMNKVIKSFYQNKKVNTKNYNLTLKINEYIKRTKQL